VASIAVSGQMLRRPSSGELLSCLQYLLGLRLLGHDVIYVEERGWLGSGLCDGDPRPGSLPVAGLVRVREILSSLRLSIPIVWVDSDAGLVSGMLWSELREALGHADLLLDVGSPCLIEQRELPARRALVDTDPLVSHVGRFAEVGYDTHFTYALGTGRTGSSAPTAGIEWVPTLPPVVPRLWRSNAPRPHAPVRVVAAYGAGPGPGGVWLGEEQDDLAAIAEIPAEIPATPLELALTQSTRRRAAALIDRGWTLTGLEPLEDSMCSYHDFITTAKAELATTRAPYRESRNGWLGHRSACFLAAGRPVIAADTGFSDWLGQGTGEEGLLAYADAGEAAEAIGRIERNPDGQSLAATMLAHGPFHYSRVLGRLLERALPHRIGALA
jgi:hypothetical protein